MYISLILGDVFMNYQIYSFRYAEELFDTNPEFTYLWTEILDVLDNITDEDLIEGFQQDKRTSKKSLSHALNTLLDQRLSAKEWARQSFIFNDSEYRPSSTNRQNPWALDFSKDKLAVEVAFNHGGNVAWNLIKPVLSSELNHVEKAIQTEAGILITATDSLKAAGNFDGAIGTYAKYIQYLTPLRNLLTVPLIIIGLEAPDSFSIDKATKQIKMKNN